MARPIAPTVVKLGGSVITVKEKPQTPNLPVIERLAREIKQADIRSLIIIHGGGSYGHPAAKEYRIAEGYKGPEQLIGFSKTRQAMMALNKFIVDALVQNNIAAVSVQPSAFILTKKGRISEFNPSLIEGMLKINLVPLLYGDAVLDEALGFSILSGDQLAVNLAINLKAKQIIIGVDVDGLYTEDPKLNPDAILIEGIKLNELRHSMKKISRARTTDVTRGMLGKILELIPAVEAGIKVKIINAKRANRLYKALRNEKVKGTEIKQR